MKVQRRWSHRPAMSVGRIKTHRISYGVGGNNNDNMASLVPFSISRNAGVFSTAGVPLAVATSTLVVALTTYSVATTLKAFRRSVTWALGVKCSLKVRIQTVRVMIFGLQGVSAHELFTWPMCAFLSIGSVYLRALCASVLMCTVVFRLACPVCPCRTVARGRCSSPGRSESFDGSERPDRFVAGCGAIDCIRSPFFKKPVREIVADFAPTLGVAAGTLAAIWAKGRYEVTDLCSLRMKRLTHRV